MKAIELTISEKLHSQSEAGQIFGQTEKLYASILSYARAYKFVQIFPK